jgi:predicted  nucleic acid-binding Zn-ribbon protein
VNFAQIRDFRPISRCAGRQPPHRIILCAAAWSGGRGELVLTLTCPNCGNDRNFQVKTLQMHVVHLEDGRVEVSEESRPAVLEVLCDECESALKFEEFEDTLRKEVLLTIGAR